MKKLLLFSVLTGMLTLLSSCFHAPRVAPSAPATPPEAQEKAVETGTTAATETNSAVSTSSAVTPRAKTETATPKVKPIPPQVFEMEAGNVFFKPTSITVKVNNPVQITFKVKGTHTFTIDELGVNFPLSAPATTINFTPKKTGTFVYYCTTPGHRLAGQWGAIIVNP